MQIKANGIRLEYAEFGPADAPALVLIRGLGSQMIHWPDALIDGFAAEGFRVITFDNRDAGLSARCPVPGVTGDAEEIVAELQAGRRPKAAYKLEDMARDVIGLMDALAIGRAHVFGVSMGGRIAQALTIDHRDRLLTATIVMSAARFAGDRVKALLAGHQDREAFIEAAVEGDRNWGSPGFPQPEDVTRAQAALAFDRGAEADGVNRQALALLASGDRRSALSAVTTRCLVIHGADDALIPVEAGREIADLIPGAELDVIDGMGHVITPALAPIIVRRVAGFIGSQI